MCKVLENGISEIPDPKPPKVTKIFCLDNITWRGTEIIDVT